MSMEHIGLADVYMARKIVSRYVSRDNLIWSKKLSKMLGFDVYLKLENIQATGSFKFRGGIYCIHRYRDEVLKRGVVTASTGNHGASIAFSTSIVGGRAKVVVPRNISDTRIQALKGYGAEVIEYGSTYEDAREYAIELSKREGMMYVDGVEEPTLYAGVGTMHLENVEAVPDMEAAIMPVGGGVCIASAKIVYKSINPDIEIYGVQPENARSFYESWKAGKPVSLGRADTIAISIAKTRGYKLPLTIAGDGISDIILVSDTEILRAVKILIEYTGQVVEPAAATSLAAAYKIRDRLAGKKVILMMTGGNIEPEHLRKALEVDIEGGLG